MEQQFQTYPLVAEYMASLVGDGHILEPTPGDGNLVTALRCKGPVSFPSGDFWAMEFTLRFDSVVMNPPFTPMKKGYDILFKCMELSDNIVALMPWLTIINSEKRMEKIEAFGLVSITHLPRKAFPGSRVQCCILELKKGFKGQTIFKTFNW